MKALEILNDKAKYNTILSGKSAPVLITEKEDSDNRFDGRKGRSEGLLSV